MKSFTISLLLLMLVCGSAFTQEAEGPIIDARHYSNVFGEIRNYRIFLPPDYFDNPRKRYPVIYYFHGWSQRYFGSTSHTSKGIDRGGDNDGDNIANYVAGHEVIVVKPDGYNRNPEGDYYLRPYNVSPVETNRQFPIYFPELVKHIDASYHTIADRDHRAVSGLSMGGFMTFWIGGKYPHLLSAAGNFCGSTEFWVGPKNSPVEYRHLDMYKNYNGMNVRLNYGDKDFIRCYHQDMNRVWTQVMDNYEYKIYNAAHSTCGLSEMYDFIMETFKNPPGKPQKWHHIDAYPEFSVWDYQISSDRDLPGFTLLENVNGRGFRCSVREFLPDGELIPSVRLSVLTAPLYEKNQQYIINDIDQKRGEVSQKVIRSDNSGRLKIHLNGTLHEIGINKMEAPPNICIASFEIENMGWATHKKEVAVSVKLLNKGGMEAKGVTAKLLTTRKSAKVVNNDSEYGTIAINEIIDSHVPFTFFVQSDHIEMERFKLLITDKNNHEWSEYLDIPLRTDQPEIREFEIADGKIFEVAEAGDDTATVYLGAGNGDGVPNPGESIVILMKDRDRYWRTFLYTSDKYVNPSGINIRVSDNWSNYDHVGGSAKYSVPVLSSASPQNHMIEFSTEYWLPDYPYHIIKRGKVKIEVTGQDSTPPQVQWVKGSGDNVIQAKAYDGGKIQSMKARLISREFPEKFIEVELNDKGKEGDREEGDHIFSKKIPDQKFGLYHVEIEAIDSFNNKIASEWPDVIVLY
ncbi:MAG: alpha/beta hydrolase-fold protein [Bacteroidota bacterium]